MTAKPVIPEELFRSTQLRTGGWTVSQNGSILVVTPVAVMSWMFVLKARENNLDPAKGPQFSVTTLIPKGSDMAKLHEAAHAAMEKKFKGRVTREQLRRYPVLDGDEKLRNYPTENNRIFAGNWYINLSRQENEGAPYVRDERGHVIEPNDTNTFQSGDYGIAVFEVWGYDNKFGKGVSTTLSGVQKIGTGAERFGGRPSEDSVAALMATDPLAEDPLGGAQIDDPLA